MAITIRSSIIVYRLFLDYTKRNRTFFSLIQKQKDLREKYTLPARMQCIVSLEVEEIRGKVTYCFSSLAAV